MKDRERAMVASNIIRMDGSVGFETAWEVATCIVKVTYARRDAAEAHARRWADDCPQEPYRCPVCGKWHLRRKGDR